MTVLAPPDTPTPAPAALDIAASRPVAWRFRAVATLDAADLATIAEILRGHAAASAVERRERDVHLRAGRAWSPVVIEAGGRRFDDPADAAAALARGAPGATVRTFGRSASVAFGRTGLAVRVDDDPALARETVGRIGRVARRRRDPLATALEAAWTVPAVVLGLPVLSSLLDRDGHAGRLTWEGMAVAIVVLIAWLCWRHLVWLPRLLSSRPSAPRSTPRPQPPAGGVVPGVTRS